jgi:phosphoribosylglycinamide formyltransferase 1
MVSIASACQTGQLPASVVGVIADRPQAAGLLRAQELSLRHSVVHHKAFASRDDFEVALRAAVDDLRPDLVVLAGFMRILSPATTTHYAGRMLNIHPSLLPQFPGLHTHAAALAAGVSEHGATVHEVTAKLDHGPIVEQVRVPVLENDTEQTLAARVLEQELQLYPRAIGKWLQQQGKA